MGMSSYAIVVSTTKSTVENHGINSSKVSLIPALCFSSGVNSEYGHLLYIQKLKDKIGATVIDKLLLFIVSCDDFLPRLSQSQISLSFCGFSRFWCFSRWMKVSRNRSFQLKKCLMIFYYSSHPSTASIAFVLFTHYSAMDHGSHAGSMPSYLYNGHQKRTMFTMTKKTTNDYL